MADCIVLPLSCNNSIPVVFTKLCLLNICSLCTGRGYRSFQKIFFRNTVFNSFQKIVPSENFLLYNIQFLDGSTVVWEILGWKFS